MKKMLTVILILFSVTVFGQGKPPPGGGSQTEKDCPRIPPLLAKGFLAELGVDKSWGPSLAYVPFEYADYPLYDWNRKIVIYPGAKPGQILEIPMGISKFRGQELPKYFEYVETCEYYAVLNGFEAYLNFGGKSLRDRQSTYKAKSTELPQAYYDLRDAQNALSDAVTDTQEGPGIHADADADVEATFALFGNPTYGENKADQKDDLDGNELSVSMIPGGPGQQIKFHTSYENNFNCTDLAWGDPNLFQAKLSCRQEMKYRHDNAVQAIKNGNELAGNLPDNGYGLRIYNSVDANLKLFGANVNLLSSEIETITRNIAEANVYANVQGTDFILQEGPSRSLSGKGDALVFEVDRSISTNIPLGIVNLKLEVGATGGVEVSYKYAAGGYEHVAKITPSMIIQGYAEVGLNLVIVGASVGGKLTIIEDTVTSLGKFSIYTDAMGLPWYDIKQTLKNEVSALDGKIYIELFLTVPKFGIPPWTKKTLEYDLINFNGYSMVGTYNAVSQDMPAFQAAF